MRPFLLICYAVAIKAAPPTCYDVATTVTNSWTCRNCFNLFVSIDMTNIISQAKWDRQIYITFEGQPELIKFAGPVTAIDPQFGSTNVYKVSFRDGHEFGDGKITFNAEFSGSESKVNSAWACPTTVMLDVGSCSSGTWSSWKDRDDPSGNCDCEEMSQFTEDYDSDFGNSGLCDNPTGTQARIKGSSAMSTTEDVRFGLNGLRCWNVDQADGRCKDYEVRFCCDSPVEEGAMYPLCDLTKTGIFEQQSDGAYDYSNDYIVKVTPKHPATGEELQNKAKILKEQGLLKHKMKQIYSDAWVSCKNNNKRSYLIKCFTDGRLEIDGKTGSEITLPSCDPIGCDPAELEQFNTKEYDLSDGCKKGYVVVNGVKLENHNNACRRKCGKNLATRSSMKIKCVCDEATQSCEYKINGGWRGWIHWKSWKFDAWAPNLPTDPFVPIDKCYEVACKTPAHEYWVKTLPALTCRDADGVQFVSNPEEWVFQQTIGFPEGAVCSQECDEHYVLEMWRADETTCKCDRDGKCKFDNRRVNSCTEAFCTTRTDNLFREFSNGFLQNHHVTGQSHFDPVMECDTTILEDAYVPIGTEKYRRVPIGESCYLKCKEGFKFAEHTEETFKLTCRQFHEHQTQWDVLGHAWDRYGDCDGEYGNQCPDWYPECIPE